MSTRRVCSLSPHRHASGLTPTGELEIVTARSNADEIIEERIERRTEVYESAPPLPMPVPAASQIIPSGTGPVIIDAIPPHHHHHPDVVKTTVVRDVSPARYTTTSYDTYDTYDTTTTSYDTYTSGSGPPAIIIGSRSRSRSREVSGRVPVGPVALAGERHHRHHHARHGSYETDELRSEIRHLEKQLARREGSRSRHRHSHSHSRHRSLSRGGGGELVRAERLSTGELVLYEEEFERIEEPSRAGPRIEKDKRGRLSISVPRYR
jgi:hypothetical protein